MSSSFEFLLESSSEKSSDEDSESLSKDLCMSSSFEFLSNSDEANSVEESSDSSSSSSRVS